MLPPESTQEKAPRAATAACAARDDLAGRRPRRLLGVGGDPQRARYAFGSHIRHFRPSRAISSSASGGPQVPAG